MANIGETAFSRALGRGGQLASLTFVALFVFSCSGDDEVSGVLQSSGGNDIKNYRTVEIGEQTWMAENLNYAVAGSVCYDSVPANCKTYGRLYNWATAMNLPSYCNSSICASLVQAKHRGICPNGWHIPTTTEWDKLLHYVDNAGDTESPYISPTAGKYLKAVYGWNDYQGIAGNREDTFDFTALPGGVSLSKGHFSDIGDFGLWWSTIESHANEARYCIVGNRNNYSHCPDSDECIRYNCNGKSYLVSVRCVKD
jgi:uncharacterized protein (TIGR02145 family)